MRGSRIIGLALTSVMSAAAPLAAQVSSVTVPRTQSTLELVPYAGYLVSQDLLTGPLGTRLTVAGGAIYGGQAAVSLIPGVALVGHVGYTQSDLEAGAPLIGGFAFGRSSAWLFDAGLQIGASPGWIRSGIAPFVQVGSGAIRRTLSAAGLEATATDFAWVVGAGADIPIGGGAAIRVLGRDYIGKFDFEEAMFLDLASETMHNIALSVGIRMAI